MLFVILFWIAAWITLGFGLNADLSYNVQRFLELLQLSGTKYLLRVCFYDGAVICYGHWERNGMWVCGSVEMPLTAATRNPQRKPSRSATFST